MHAVDCSEVQRVRERFDASHLHILKPIENKENALNELAQLITEVKGGIEARGEAYKKRNFALKKAFHHAGVYESIKDIYFSQTDLEEKKKEESLSFRHSHTFPVISKLYNKDGFNESMSIEKLPTEELLQVKSIEEEKMRQGRLYARALVRPTQFIDPKISKRTKTT